MGSHPNDVWQNNFNQIQGSLERLNIECVQRHISMIQPSNSKQPWDLSHFECNTYIYYFKLIKFYSYNFKIWNNFMLC